MLEDDARPASGGTEAEEMLDLTGSHLHDLEDVELLSTLKVGAFRHQVINSNRVCSLVLDNPCATAGIGPHSKPSACLGSQNPCLDG